MTLQSSRIAARLLIATLLLAGPAPGFGYASFTPDSQPVGWLAQAAVTSFDLSSNNEIVYSPGYYRSDWSGNLFAYPVSSTGVVDRPGEIWGNGAGPLIDGQNYATGRRIVTMKDDGTKVAFRWASLSAAQQATIGNATDGPKILNYVRGDRSNEAPAGNQYRVRGSVLGDILHSRPLYVPGTHKMVYVGANDGMLHAINADDGSEAYAYVPSMLIPKLKNLAPLASAGYTHTHFVDASPNAGSAVISGASKTILVGGLGAGGKGLYALDITSDAAAAPTTEAAASSRILWEITPTRISGSASTAYAKLGYTYGVPVIAKANSGSGQSAVFMPNGYLSTAGTAVLYVIDATNGSLIRAIDTASGSAGSPNGLSGITAIDTNADGRVDYIYGGDLDGQLWKFDVTSSATSSWTATLLYTTSPVQPIVVPPSASLHPSGGYMVNFATGALFTAADEISTTTYYAYGIHDGGSGTTLITQTMTNKTYTDAGYTGPDQDVRVTTDNAPNWSTDKGWKVALPAGERVVGDTSFIESSRFYFTSTNPTVNPTGDPAGENWLYELDYLTGGVTVTTPFFDLNRDLLLNNSDRVKNGAGSPIAGAGGIPVAKKLEAGVVSQPVLVELQQLNTTLFQQNPNSVAPVPPNDLGVSGGHFDIDHYYSGGSKTATWKSQKHIHEYDDIYDVTGVNFLNASSAALNLAFSVTSTSTPFKILIGNQYLNPAAKVKIGAVGAYTALKSYTNLATSTDATAVLAAQPVYTRATVTNFLFNLPLDAFASKDWWGDGGAPRAGLIPTQTGCVIKMSWTSSSTPTAAQWDPTPGRQGERHNGALTFQVIKSTTPASALELNVAGDARYGWRVKRTDHNTYVLAEYTAFWHHPNGLCYKAADTAWTPAPEQDFVSDAKPADPAAGSADPTDGSFTGGSVVSTTTTTVNNVTTTITLYADSTTLRIVTTNNADGSKTIVTTNPDGTTSTVTLTQGTVFSGADESALRPRTGRVSWREMYR